MNQSSYKYSMLLMDLLLNPNKFTNLGFIKPCFYCFWGELTPQNVSKLFELPTRSKKEAHFNAKWCVWKPFLRVCL